MHYDKDRQQVISLYKQGQRQQGTDLHWEIRGHFQEIYNLCGRYKLIHEQRIAEAKIRKSL